MGGRSCLSYANSLITSEFKMFPSYRMLAQSQSELEAVFSL